MVLSSYKLALIHEFMYGFQTDGTPSRLAQISLEMAEMETPDAPAARAARGRARRPECEGAGISLVSLSFVNSRLLFLFLLSP